MIYLRQVNELPLTTVFLFNLCICKALMFTQPVVCSCLLFGALHAVPSTSFKTDI